MTEPFSVKETDQKISDINFEPGYHPNTDEERTALNNAIKLGDLTAHGWNPEVKERMEKRAFDKPALVIASDGDTASPFPGDKDFYFNIVSRAFQTWAGFPGRPNELNHTGIVYAVRGDTENNWVPAVALGDAKIASASIDVDSEYTFASDQALLRSKSIETVLRPIVFIGIMLGSNEVAKKVSHLMPLKIERPRPDRMSRRDFLKIVGVLAGAFFMATTTDIGSTAQTKSTFAQDDFSKTFWQRIDEIASAKLFKPTWVDARTGMLFSKMEDVQAAGFALPQGTEYDIVMGAGHNTDQNSMHRDKKARAATINDYAKSMIKDGKIAYSIFTGVSINQVPDAAINRLLDFMSLTELVKVTDPGGPDKQRDLMQNLTSYFTSIATFHSPQIEDTIKSLRPTS